MSIFQIPWQAFFTVIAVIAALSFGVFYLVRFFKDDLNGIKDPAVCVDKPNPKIVRLEPNKEANPSIVSMKADREK